MKFPLRPCALLEVNSYLSRAFLIREWKQKNYRQSEQARGQKRVCCSSQVGLKEKLRNSKYRKIASWRNFEICSAQYVVKQMTTEKLTRDAERKFETETWVSCWCRLKSQMFSHSSTAETNEEKFSGSLQKCIVFDLSFPQRCRKVSTFHISKSGKFSVR